MPRKDWTLNQFVAGLEMVWTPEGVSITIRDKATFDYLTAQAVSKGKTLDEFVREARTMPSARPRSHHDGHQRANHPVNPGPSR
jgi:hypothetical protein